MPAPIFMRQVTAADARGDGVGDAVRVAVAEVLTVLVAIADTEIVIEFSGEFVAINGDAEARKGLGDNDKDGDKDSDAVADGLLDTERESITLDEIDTVSLTDAVRAEDAEAIAVESTVDDGLVDTLFKVELEIETVADVDRVTMKVEESQLLDEDVTDAKSVGVTNSVADSMADAVGACVDDSLAELKDDGDSSAKVLEKVTIIINAKNKTLSLREVIIACI
jgi:hypothetical protein